MCYLGGETVGKAIADLITGRQAPGGRLAESWPYVCGDNPSAAYFPGYQKTVEYRESIYVGYRYYDTASVPVRFPFGFGLSYTTFEYGEPVVDSPQIDDTDTLTVTVSIKNTGDIGGSEVVQLYVAHENPTIFKAAQELKGFEKVFLAPGECKNVSFKLDKRAFAYYNTKLADWHVESGEYEIRISASSRDIRGSVRIRVNSTVDVSVPDYRETAPAYYDLKNGISNMPDEQFVAILGRSLPPRERDKSKPFDENATFGEISEKLIGRVFANRVKKEAAKVMAGMADDIGEMLSRMFEDMPLRSLVMVAGGKVPPKLVEGLLTALNGQVIKGVLMMGRK